MGGDAAAGRAGERGGGDGASDGVQAAGGGADSAEAGGKDGGAGEGTDLYFIFIFIYFNFFKGERGGKQNMDNLFAVTLFSDYFKQGHRKILRYPP